MAQGIDGEDGYSATEAADVAFPCHLRRTRSTGSAKLATFSPANTGPSVRGRLFVYLLSPTTGRASSRSG